jgi:ribosomal protein S17
LVPVNYVEEASPLKIASAMFDYTATNEEEISLQEGDYVRIYELVDGNWW